MARASLQPVRVLTAGSNSVSGGAHRLARRLGLPLGREVEVWLKDGVRLRGLLRLKEAMLFLENVDERSLELAVGKVDFRHADIESCVRMD